MKQLLYQMIIIIILIILIIIGIKHDNNTSTIRTDKRNFSVLDTLSINNIKLTNRNLENINLARNDTYWTLNDSLIANQYSINLLLKTIKEMRIKQPVARAALDNVIRRMGVQNTKVTFYHDKQEIKTIFIGGETADQLGTFMMLEGAKEPYVVHIPGFNGYLSSRFHCKEDLWRDKTLFRNAEKIYYSPINDKLLNNDTLSKKWLEIDLIKLKNTYCEQFLGQSQLKQIRKRKPFITFKLYDNTEQEKYIYCYRKKPPNKDKYKMNEFDQERFYLIKENSLMLVQYKQFDSFILSEKNLTNFKP